MDFLANLFWKKTKAKSVVLIDIGADSLAGAYALYREGESPMLLYTRRVPIELHKEEVRELAMLRALKILGKDLIREGAPALARAAGSGSVGTIVVSVDAPWQETRVHTEHFEKEEPFIFTKGLVSKRLEASSSVAPSEKLLADESVIGTILNGYETQNPYGKRAHRADVIVLTSFIEKQIASDIIATLRGLYHSKNILPIAGNSLRYQTIRALFPHEDDAIILDATSGSVTSVALVRKGIFVSMTHLIVSSSGETWVPQLTGALAEIARQYPLPRTIFLLAREPEISSLHAKLAAADFASLWLSDNPPKIVPVLKNHITGLIRQSNIASPDIVLLLMTLFYRAKAEEEGF